jgi:hypothetical protein
MKFRSVASARAATASMLGILVGVGNTAAFGSAGCDKVQNKDLNVYAFGGATASSTVSGFAVGDHIVVTTGCLGGGWCSSTWVGKRELRTGNGTKIEGNSYEVKGVDDDKTLTLEIAVLGRQTLFGFARAECTPAGAK